MVASQIGLRDPDQHAAVAAALREAARKKLETFPDDIECIRALCRDCDPLALLSVIGSYGATYAIKAVEIPQSTLLPGVEQHHIELLHAILLTVGAAERGFDPAAPTHVQEVLDRLGPVSDAFVASRIDATPQGRAGEEMVLEQIQERVRFHTQAVRNWGYFEEVVDTLEQLYGEDEEELSKRLGFGPSSILKIVSAVQDRFTERVEKHFLVLRRCASD